MPTTDDWSTTPVSNGTASGINIAEGCDAGNLNNWGREIMSQLKTKLDAVDLAVTAAGGQDATLTAIAGVAFAANQMLLATAADIFTTVTTTSYGRGLLNLADAAALLTALGFAASGTAASGHADIPFPTYGTLRINWGSTTVGANTSTTDNFHAAFSATPVAFGSMWDTSTSAADNWYVGNPSTTTIGLTNGSSTGNVFSWLAFGKA